MNHKYLNFRISSIIMLLVLMLTAGHANAGLDLAGTVQLPSGITTQDIDPVIRVIAYDAQMDIVQTFSASIAPSAQPATPAPTVYNVSATIDDAKIHKYLLLIGCYKCDGLAIDETYIAASNVNYVFTPTVPRHTATRLATFTPNFDLPFQGTLLESVFKYIYLLGAMLVFFIKEFI